MAMAILSFFPWLRGPPPCKNEPKLTPNDGKLIFGFGQKWSRGGPKVVPERWFVASQQNHAVLTGTCCSAKIISLCQDHHPLPRSSSSAKILILGKAHDPLLTNIEKYRFSIDCCRYWFSICLNWPFSTISSHREHQKRVRSINFIQFKPPKTPLGLPKGQ